MPVSKSKMPRAKTAAVHKPVADHIDAPLLESLVKTVTIKPYHHKPFRIRHIGWLFLALLALFGLTLQTGLMIGRSHAPNNFITPQVAEPSKTSLTAVRSAYGFSLGFDGNQFTATASAVEQNGNSHVVPTDQLRENKNINTITLRPLLGQVPASQVATRLTLQVAADKKISVLKQQADNEGLSNVVIAAKQFPIVSSADFDVLTSSSTAETLNGVFVQKTIYQYMPKFGGGSTYTVAYAGVINDQAFVLRLDGLVGSSVIPDIYQPVFDTLALSAAQKVEGVSTLFSQKASADSASQLDSKYASDLVSPAVVKIYHLICGTLVVGGQSLGKNTCDGSTGSGFLASRDGYIATNGHVVVFTAKDAFAESLIGDPAFFASFLKSIGLTNAQISVVAARPDLQASILAKIYDLSDDKIKFDNLQETTLVSLGSEPLKINSVADIRTFINKKDTDSIKRATVVATNYSPKDLYVLMSGNDKGFSSSDVALLKINVMNAPVVGISTSSVTQNQKISLVGFPGDAENELVSQDKLSVSVTNGSVSSIREAAGGVGKLYQSDADASHGNSGGPALGEDDLAIGLLTYRVQDPGQGNAAKSYIRDIADFTKLVDSKHVTLNTDSITQDAWKKGLTLVSTNHYSAAIKQFDKVKSAYPSHRLVDSYIASSKQAIAAGKDVKSFPIVLLLGGIVLSLAGVGIAVFMIVRHHGKHQLYKAGTQVGASGVPSMLSGQPIQTVPAPPTPVAPSSLVPQITPLTVPIPPSTQPVAPQPPAGPMVVQPAAQAPVDPPKLVQ